MAFVSILSALPDDGVNVSCRIFFYPGELAACTFDATNQVFNVTASGVVIPASFVIEWELI
jgi:hypothetical protein